MFFATNTGRLEGGLWEHWRCIASFDAVEVLRLPVRTEALPHP